MGAVLRILRPLQGPKQASEASFCFLFLFLDNFDLANKAPLMGLLCRLGIQPLVRLAGHNGPRAHGNPLFVYPARRSEPAPLEERLRLDPVELGIIRQ